MIEPFDDVAFSAKAADEGTGLRVTFSGSTEIDTTALLDRFLEGLHKEACARGVPEVTADLRQAAFVNSACLKALARWILAATEEPARYRINFVSTRSHAWQRRSLAALSALAPASVSITIE